VSEIAMPRLSDSMEEGTILAWHKQVGEEVAVGEELVEIETDKANMGYEADVAGTLLEIVVGENESAPVGAVIARVGDPQAAGPVTAGDPPPLPVAEASSGGVPPTVPPAAPASAIHARVRISPLAKRAAAGRGISLDGIAGTGPYGRVMRADVEAASSVGEILAAGPAAAAPEPGAAGSTAPEFTLRATVEMSPAVALREEIKRLEAGGPKPSFNDFVVKAVALALRRHPRLNSGWRDGQIEHYGKVNVGVAVADGDDLLVPVVADADTLSIGRIAERTRDLVAAVKDNAVTPAEPAGATFTVSNLGMFGIDSFEAILNPPQAAILAVGAIGRVPGFDSADELTVSRPMAIVLTCDHRIVSGAAGARFLGSVKELLEQPLRLLG
jgi:pyruvate dehydrogenase E2 component (dihydrolipoamide acetyltransferase)